MSAVAERPGVERPHALVEILWRSLSSNGIGRSDAARLQTALAEGAAR